MGQMASESAPVALDPSGRNSQSARGNVTIRNSSNCNALAVEGFLAVVYYHGLMRRRDLS